MQRVTVANAEVVRADIVLKQVAKVQPADPATDAVIASAPPDDGRTGLVAGAIALLALLVVGAAAMGYRRATG